MNCWLFQISDARDQAIVEYNEDEAKRQHEAPSGNVATPRVPEAVVLGSTASSNHCT